LGQGIPVVSTEVGGIPELLNGRGEVVSLGDFVETKLADALLKVIEVPRIMFETEIRSSREMVEE